MVLVYVLNSYSPMIESAEHRKENTNQIEMWMHKAEINFLNNADIVRRTQKDIEWHNLREIAYRKRREVRMRDQRVHPAV